MRRATWQNRGLATAFGLLTLTVFALLPAAAIAWQQPEEVAPAPEIPAWESHYLLPPERVRQIIDTDRSYATLDNVAPDGRTFLVAHYSGQTDLKHLAEPTQRLAMLELRGQHDRTWRLDTHGIHALELFALGSRTWRPVALPEGTLVSDMVWSPDGSRLAFLLHGPEHTRVWIADTATGRAHALSDAPVLATLATRTQNARPRVSRLLQFTPAGTVLAVLVPPDRGPVPQQTLPAGPVLRHTREHPERNPTYPFLLRDRLAAEQFRYYTTGRIAQLRPDAPPQWLGEPGMFESLALSPDGRYLLVERIVEPLSPLTSYRGFGRRLEIWTIGGRKVATVRNRPLHEGRRPGDDPGRELPREVQWLPDGSGLAWLQPNEPQQQPDTAGPGTTAQADSTDRGDRIVRWLAPFTPGSQQTIVSLQQTLRDLVFDADATHAFAVRQHAPDQRDLVIFDLSEQQPTAHLMVGPWDPRDPLAQPGELVRKLTGNGRASARLSSDHRHAFLQGPGWRADFRPRPFLDRVALDGSGTERLFEGAESMWERPLVLLDDDARRLVVQRQGPAIFPNSWLWTRDGGFGDQLTHNLDPFPQITAARRFDFQFTRRDGTRVQARVSMPVDWDGHSRVPAVFWTYPREYRSAKEYQRAAIRSRNRNAFPLLNTLRWSDIWLTQGYAVVYPDVPIIGDPYNDFYIQHLSDTLYAAIRKVDEQGWIDVDRIGHGGHSYGAFATANLLAHTPYFKAGIAGDGAYNRTLTPMGFQNERRLLWDNREVYLEMSPLFHADHIDTPLLMYHGGDDNNTGTWPTQSRRMMQALTALGKTAELVVYPFESHGPRARASLLDLWARWLAWFDRYVKSPPSGDTTEPTSRLPQ